MSRKKVGKRTHVNAITDDKASVPYIGSKTIYLSPYSLSRDLRTFYIATLYLLWVICMGTFEKADTHALLSLIRTRHIHFYDKYLRHLIRNLENFQLVYHRSQFICIVTCRYHCCG